MSNQTCTTGCGHSHNDSHDYGHDHNHSHDHQEHSHSGCGCSHGALEKEKGHTGLILTVAAALALLSVLPVWQPYAWAFMVAATLIAGWSMFILGVKGAFRLSLDEMTLITIAVIAAFALGEFAEAALVTILFRLGGLFEEMAEKRSQRSIDALASIRPEFANLLEQNGNLRRVQPGEVPIGAQIVVKTGERVPIDAIITQGAGMFDTSAITGESAIAQLTEGDTVLSGMVNVSGAPVCKTTASFENSAAMRIIELVRGAAAQKGKTEAFITKFAKIYTPIVVVIAALLTFVPPLLGYGWYVQRALVFLVASCPCAMVISVPLSFFSGLGAASKAGILIKGTRYLEILSKLKTVVFDKTGTLTQGKLSVENVTPYGSFNASQVLELAAVAESRSDHPIAHAIVKHFAKDINNSAISNYTERAGYGVELSYNGNTVVCGSGKHMQACGIDMQAAQTAQVYIAVDGSLAGSITLSDNPREDAAQTISQLHQIGIQQVAMLTGDNQATATAIGKALGVNQIHAQLLPEDKVTQLQAIKATGDATAFVGDGINDAPVLAAADVGIAMGLGTDIAIQSADVVLMSNKLSALPKAILLARRAMNVARFNIWFALCIKAVVLVLGPLGMVNMWMAVFADVGVTILTVLNASRLLSIKSK